jgi:hypothetical protein
MFGSVEAVNLRRDHKNGQLPLRTQWDGKLARIASRYRGLSRKTSEDPLVFRRSAHKSVRGWRWPPCGPSMGLSLRADPEVLLWLVSAAYNAVCVSSIEERRGCDG